MLKITFHYPVVGEVVIRSGGKYNVLFLNDKIEVIIFYYNGIKFKTYETQLHIQSYNYHLFCF